MEQDRIPKIIHYSWLSNDPYPETIAKCIDSWHKKLPEYEFIKWDTTNFDVNSCLYTKQAFELKKYTYVSDYIRLYALYNYGGIYLDCDIEVLKSFDPLLLNNAFSCFESKNIIAAWIFGSRKNNPIFKEFLNYYKQHQFILSDGEYDKTPNTIPFTEICKKHGLILNNRKQVLDAITIYPMTYFCPYNPYRKGEDDFSDNTYAVHLFSGSWLDAQSKKKMIFSKRYKDHYGEKLGNYLGELMYRIKMDGIMKTFKYIYGKRRKLGICIKKKN